MSSQIDSSELIAPGTRLGKYEIVHRIAYGGMAEIYLARASGIQGFEKHVVLKRILPQYAENQELVRMFLKEARLAAGLDHPNIAHVYDIGETRGSFFFTMEYLHGEDVRRITRELKRMEARLPLEHAMEIAIGAASGLHCAHDKKGPDGRSLGIVHRDISPSNLVVTFHGGVKVVDFGVAKITADPELSRRHSLKGKLAYMSPEQLSAQTVDRRSDVYSLGVVIYEITTHARLFKATTDVETMRLVLERAIPAPSSLVPDYPPDLEAIVMRAMEKDPEKRYPTARALQLDLEAFTRNHKLEVSSASLAVWMESTFGPKSDPWQALPPMVTGPTEIPLESPSAEPTAATRAVSHHPGVSPVTPAVLANPNTPVTPATPGSAAPAEGQVGVPVGVMPAHRPRRRVALAGALITVVALAGAALAVGRARSGRPAPGAMPAAAGNTAVLVMAEGGNVAIEGKAVAAPPPLPPPAPPSPESGAEQTVTPAPPRAPNSITRARRRELARTARAAPSGESFSASFARHEPAIRRCFTAAAGQPGAIAGEIALRFQTARDGRVTSVAVQPPAVASTPLGACLVDVGLKTAFAPQPEPMAFRIPLTVQPRGGRTP
jgi:serine/threonine protein kinase